MKKVLILIILILCVFNAYSQESVIINKHPQKVPKGKKWVLSTSSTSLIQVNESAFISGNICNAQLLSNPRVIGGVMELAIHGRRPYPQKRISIHFKSLSKVAYANEYTFEISSITGFSIFTYSTANTEEVNDIIFYEGQTIVTEGCLESIEIVEKSMTATERKDVYNTKNTKINESKFFIGTKRFCDGLGGWVYEVTITNDNILLKLFPGNNNGYHKNKSTPKEVIKGKLEMGKINTNDPPEYLTNRFKFENGTLYEVNNEGGYNSYKECK